MNELKDQLQDVFRSVFDQPGIELADDMTADHVEGWDSLMHINLVIAIEREFEIKFTTTEMSGVNGEFANIGTLLQLIATKKGLEPSTF